MVSAVMESRPDGVAAIHPNDIFVIFDGGKRGPSLQVFSDPQDRQKPKRIGLV